MNKQEYIESLKGFKNVLLKIQDSKDYLEMIFKLSHVINMFDKEIKKSYKKNV